MKGTDLYAPGQNLIVQFLYFLMDAFECGLRIVALLQHRDARNHIVVVDDFAVFPC